MTKLSPFRVSDHLDSGQTIADYLTAAAEDENPDVLLAAISEIARARGMTRVAADTGLGRESLYKTLAPGAHPRFETINAIVRAFGVKLSFGAPKPPIDASTPWPMRRPNGPDDGHGKGLPTKGLPPNSNSVHSAIAVARAAVHAHARSANAVMNTDASADTHPGPADATADCAANAASIRRSGD